MKKRFKVYVACALTNVPENLRSKHLQVLDMVKSELRVRDYSVIDFLSAFKENPTPKDVYSYDIQCLQEADCVLALCDFPGTGLGYEICFSVLCKKIPTLVAVTDEANLSKLIRGIGEINYKYVVFNETSELLEKFDNFVRSFYEKNN